jgi:hypothetical protein
MESLREAAKMVSKAACLGPQGELQARAYVRQSDLHYQYDEDLRYEEGRERAVGLRAAGMGFRDDYSVPAGHSGPYGSRGEKVHIVSGCCCNW